MFMATTKNIKTTKSISMFFSIFSAPKKLRLYSRQDLKSASGKADKISFFRRPSAAGFFTLSPTTKGLLSKNSLAALFSIKAYDEFKSA